MPPVSAIVITKNEADAIADALASLSWADELIVVDSESTDDTVAIARRFTDRVYVRPWPGYVDQKNHAAALATHDWIFSLDADERVTEELRDEIRTLLRSEPDDARIPDAARVLLSRAMDAYDRHVSGLPAAALRPPPRALGRAARARVGQGGNWCRWVI